MSQLIECEACHNALSDQAAFCPKCGHPVRWTPSSAKQGNRDKTHPVFKVIGSILVAAFFVMIAWIWLDGSSANQPEKTPDPSSTASDNVPAAPATTALPAPSAPSTESRVLALVAQYAAPYVQMADTNEIKATMIFNARNKALCAVLVPDQLDISKWVGRISQITDNFGSAQVIISASPYVSFSDTDIPLSSGLASKLSKMRAGDRVTFSGTFQPGIKNCVSEDSFTESGSMSAPEFSVTISSIQTAAGG